MTFLDENNAYLDCVNDELTSFYDKSFKLLNL